MNLGYPLSRALAKTVAYSGRWAREYQDDIKLRRDRGEIKLYVKENPGSTFRSICQDLHLKPIDAAFHIYNLEEWGSHVVHIWDGLTARFYEHDFALRSKMLGALAGIGRPVSFDHLDFCLRVGGSFPFDDEETRECLRLLIEDGIIIETERGGRTFYVSKSFQPSPPL